MGGGAVLDSTRRGAVKPAAEVEEVWVFGLGKVCRCRCFQKQTALSLSAIHW